MYFVIQMEKQLAIDINSVSLAFDAVHECTIQEH